MVDERPREPITHNPRAPSLGRGVLLLPKGWTMQIEIKKIQPTGCRFINLKAGDCFLGKDDIYYMVYEDESSGELRSVDFNGNNVSWMDSADVLRVRATVVITRERGVE